MDELLARFLNLAGVEGLVAPMGTIVEAEGCGVGFGENGLDVALAVPGETGSQEHVEKTMHGRARRSSVVGERVDRADAVVQAGGNFERKATIGAGKDVLGDVLHGG